MSENMIFEGRTEREAIEKAAVELGSESFDVEVIEKTGGLFGFGKVKIRVKALDSIPSHMNSSSMEEKKAPTKSRKKIKRGNQPALGEKAKRKEKEKEEKPPRPIKKEHVQKTISFVEETVRLMGIEATITETEMAVSKVRLEINTEDSNKVIGRKGKTLDSLQILANVYFYHMDDDNNFWRIVLDSEGYRERREESLIHQALRAADKVSGSHSSHLLEPMNPFERHLVHKALSEMENIVTHSEGDGHYKRIRIKAKNAGNRKPSRPRR